MGRSPRSGGPGPTSSTPSPVRAVGVLRTSRVKPTTACPRLLISDVIGKLGGPRGVPMSPTPRRSGPYPTEYHPFSLPITPPLPSLSVSSPPSDSTASFLLYGTTIHLLGRCRSLFVCLPLTPVSSRPFGLSVSVSSVCPVLTVPVSDSLCQFFSSWVSLSFSSVCSTVLAW